MKQIVAIFIVTFIAFWLGYALGGNDARIMHPCSQSQAPHK